MRYRWLSITAWAAMAVGAAAVGLAAVSAVRNVVADAPVRVLTASDVDRLLQDPESELAPIAIVAAAPSDPERPESLVVPPAGTESSESVVGGYPSGARSTVSAQGATAAEPSSGGSAGGAGAGTGSTSGQVSGAGLGGSASPVPTDPTPSVIAGSPSPTPRVHRSPRPRRQCRRYPHRTRRRPRARPTRRPTPTPTDPTPSPSRALSVPDGSDTVAVRPDSDAQSTPIGPDAER